MIFKVVEVNKIAKLTTLEAVDAPHGYRHTLIWEYGVDEEFNNSRCQNDTVGMEYNINWKRKQ